MVKEINLSDFFPIQAAERDGNITIFLHKIVAGEVSPSELKKLARRQLGNEQLRLDIKVDSGKLIIAFDAPPDIGLDEEKVASTVGDLISKLLPPTLRNRITGKKLVYITKASAIPLIGRIDFGIIDRGTNLIQVRPVTGCVLDCPFCSVDSGLSSRTRVTDFMIDQSYMVEELRRLCELKGSKSIELHIDGQGEPTLYPHLTTLIKELSVIDGVDTISLQTNGVPLTHDSIDELEGAGLSRINLSVNALDSDRAAALSGIANYSLNHILGLIEHIKDSHIALLVAPLWIPKLNDDEILKIVRFVKKLGIRTDWPILGIQNYLIHRQGRTVRQIRPCSMRSFRQKLEQLSNLFDIPNLILRRGDFKIRPMKSYPTPFKIGETVEIELVAQGRLVGEMVGVGRGRALHILTKERDIGKRKLVRIIRTKHNIFIGKTTSG